MIESIVYIAACGETRGRANWYRVEMVGGVACMEGCEVYHDGVCVDCYGGSWPKKLNNKHIGDMVFIVMETGRLSFSTCSGHGTQVWSKGRDLRSCAQASGVQIPPMSLSREYPTTKLHFSSSVARYSYSIQS